MGVDRTEPSVGAAGDAELHLGRISARLSRLLEVALAEVDLTVPQYRLLAFLDEGGAAASALAERLGVTRPTITAVVDGLVARGFVERVPDPDDRRRIDHVMTAQGRRVLAAADNAAQSRMEEIAGFSRKSKATTLVRGLQAWREALDAHLLAMINAHATAHVVGASSPSTATQESTKV